MAAGTSSRRSRRSPSDKSGSNRGSSAHGRPCASTAPSVPRDAVPVGTFSTSEARVRSVAGTRSKVGVKHRRGMRAGGGSRVRAVVAAGDSYPRCIGLAVRQRRSPRSPPAPVASAGALCRHARLTILHLSLRTSSQRRPPPALSSSTRLAQDKAHFSALLRSFHRHGVVDTATAVHREAPRSSPVGGTGR